MNTISTSTDTRTSDLASFLCVRCLQYENCTDFVLQAGPGNEATSDWLKVQCFCNCFLGTHYIVYVALSVCIVLMATKLL